MLQQSQIRLWLILTQNGAVALHLWLQLLGKNLVNACQYSVLYQKYFIITYQKNIRLSIFIIPVIDFRLYQLSSFRQLVPHRSVKVRRTKKHTFFYFALNLYHKAPAKIRKKFSNVPKKNYQFFPERFQSFHNLLAFHKLQCLLNLRNYTTSFPFLMNFL